MLTASAGALGSIGIVKYGANAAEFNYKFSTTVADTEPLSTRAIEAASKIYRDSNGRLDIRVYPNSALGGDVETLEQVRLGAVEFCSLGNLVLANTVPVAGISTLPFIFSSYDQAWSVCDGALGKYVQGAAEKAGFYVFPKSFEGNFNNTFNNVRPIATPADVKGLKIRVQPGPVLVALFKALGGTPVSISFREVYTSLQTKLIDGMVTGTSYVESSKFYEVLKYASTTNHVFSALATIANAASLQRLPKNLRDLVDKHFYEGAVLARVDSHRLDEEALRKLATQGMSVNSCSLPAFRAEVRKAGLYTQWKATYGDEAWSVLEKAVGPLS